MANMQVRDANGTVMYVAATGVGSNADPFTMQHRSGGWDFTKTLTVTNGVYVIGDVVGGLITITGAAAAVGGRGIINTVKLCGVSALAYEMWFFTADVADVNIVDQDPLTLVAADALLFQGVIPIAAADYNAAASAFNNATVRGCGLQYHCGAASTSLIAYLKATAVTAPGTTTIYAMLEGEFIS